MELCTIKNNFTFRSFLNELVRLEIIREQFRDIIIENLETYQVLLPIMNIGERERHLSYLKKTITKGGEKINLEIWRLRPAAEKDTEELAKAWFDIAWQGKKFHDPQNLFLVHALCISLAK